MPYASRRVAEQRKDIAAILTEKAGNGKFLCCYMKYLSADKFEELETSNALREFPRLCRGGSSSLTFPGVHPGNSKA
jgi:hypothetical protein